MNIKMILSTLPCVTVVLVLLGVPWSFTEDVVPAEYGRQWSRVEDECLSTVEQCTSCSGI